MVTKNYDIQLWRTTNVRSGDARITHSQRYTGGIIGARKIAYSWFKKYKLTKNDTVTIVDDDIDEIGDVYLENLNLFFNHPTIVWSASEFGSKISVLNSDGTIRRSY